MDLKNCLREPIRELYDAARYLDAAVTAHLEGNNTLAADLIKAADKPEVREWTESLWGTGSPYINKIEIPGAPNHLAKDKRIPVRMPNTSEKALLHKRDGFHCRFCGVPVIRMEVRQAIKKDYPEVLGWGSRNVDQHAAFQAMWLQYDHVVPHARGGDNSLDNIVITCAPCNYGRCDSLVEEVGLIDPRNRQPVRSLWDGLERYLG